MPYSPGGSAAVVGVVETQVDCLLQLIDRMLNPTTLSDLQAVLRKPVLKVKPPAISPRSGHGGHHGKLSPPMDDYRIVPPGPDARPKIQRAESLLDMPTLFDAVGARLLE
jgi:hypothetical protein